MSFWSDAPWGFGSNGGRDGCVYSGEFGKDKWSLTNGECLKRNFNGMFSDLLETSIFYLTFVAAI